MRLFAEYALLPSGWARDVAIVVAADGTIHNVEPHSQQDRAERLAGPVVPGMPNVHSHAFQRALAGRTGRKSDDETGADSFWTWRDAMYRFLDAVDTDSFEAITTQAYVEMVEAGYTSVAEFHYVHHDRDGISYANRSELALRVVAASERAGIALTLLPVFYAHSAVNRAPPTPRQRRFVHSLDGFARLIEDLQSQAAAHRYVLGVAAHSLRAVTPDEIAVVVEHVHNGPIHIHAAEQPREVAECIAVLGQRPIEWLLDHVQIDRRWCVVHATHMTADEVKRLATSGAVAGLAPTTEADLGDGTFAAHAFVGAGGTLAIGTDSNTCIDPFAELRQLEWSQRLAMQQRNLLARREAAVGQSLYTMASAGGAQALAQPIAAIQCGNRADLVVLDTTDAALLDQRVEDVLDAAVFGPCRRPVRDVMVGGQWVVRDGRHTKRESVLRDYRAALAKVSA